MLIALLVTIYILIACVVGCAIYVYYKDEEDSGVAGLFGGIFWPLAIVFILMCKLFTFICSNICKVFEYLKNEGFHYCKEDIKPCCGQCKYMYYWNNHNEINGCEFSEGARLSSTSLPCSRLRKHWLWRFRIRYKWDNKS